MGPKWVKSGFDPFSQGQISTHGILRLRNPNLDPNSGKRILGARILDPNSWVEFFEPVFSSKKSPPRKIHPQEIHLSKFTFQNSTQKSGHKIHIAPLQGLLTDIFTHFCTPKPTFHSLLDSLKGALRQPWPQRKICLSFWSVLLCFPKALWSRKSLWGFPFCFAKTNQGKEDRSNWCKIVIFLGFRNCSSKDSHHRISQLWHVWEIPIHDSRTTPQCPCLRVLRIEKDNY